MRTILAIIGIVVAIAIFVSIFLKPDLKKLPGRNNKQEIALTIDLQEIKPAQWQPIFDKGLLQINIDDDPEAEWLFFYRNTGDANQIGGVIYDAQNQPRGDLSIPISQQYPAYLTPYFLLPDYTAGKNQGYMGDDAVQHQGAVARKSEPQEDGESSQGKQEGVIVGDYLQVRGVFRNRTNRVSISWWIDKQTGYGGALAYTPGWFSLSKDNPNWPDWGKDDAQGPLIQRLWAWEPQTDRANICRRVEWRLVGDDFVADYDQSDLMFCTGVHHKSGEDDADTLIAAAEPAFPESQVLAYLVDHNAARWKNPDAAFPLSGEVKVRRITAPQNTNPAPDAPYSYVDVDFDMGGMARSMVWTLEMQQPHSVKDSVKWRIIEAHDR